MQACVQKGSSQGTCYVPSSESSLPLLEPQPHFLSMEIAHPTFLPLGKGPVSGNNTDSPEEALSPSVKTHLRVPGTAGGGAAVASRQDRLLSTLRSHRPGDQKICSGPSPTCSEQRRAWYTGPVPPSSSAGTSESPQPTRQVYRESAGARWQVDAQAAHTCLAVPSAWTPLPKFTPRFWEVPLPNRPSWLPCLK